MSEAGEDADVRERVADLLELDDAELVQWRLRDLLEQRETAPGTARARLTVEIHAAVREAQEARRARGDDGPTTPSQFVEQVIAHPHLLLEAFERSPELHRHPVVRRLVLEAAAADRDP